MTTDATRSRSAAPSMSTEELTRLATLYFIDGQTQDELSRRLGISRATVGRMIKRAQDLGIVEIRVRHHPTLTVDLERELIDHFGISRALLSVDHANPDKCRALLAGLVATWLDRNLSAGAIVAVGMGRNVSAASEPAMSPPPRAAAFVCAIGGSYRGGETMNPDHICRRLAARFGGESQTLYAPGMIDDAAVRSALLENDTVRQSLDKARRARRRDDGLRLHRHPRPAGKNTDTGPRDRPERQRPAPHPERDRDRRRIEQSHGHARRAAHRHHRHAGDHRPQRHRRAAPERRDHAARGLMRTARGLEQVCPRATKILAPAPEL